MLGFRINSLALCLALALSSVNASLGQALQNSPRPAAGINRYAIEQLAAVSELEEMEQMLRKHPNDFRVHFALGRAYEAIGMKGLADEEDEICQKAGPAFNQYIFHIFQERVRVLDYQGAMTLFRYVEKYFPSEPTVLLIGSLLLDRQGRLAEAEDNLRKALSLSPHEPGVYTMLGHLRTEQGQYSEAEKYFDQELKRRPAFLDAIIGKGQIARSVGRYNTALKQLAPLYVEMPFRRGIADAVAECLVRTGLLNEAAAPSLVAIAAAAKEGDLKQAKDRVVTLWPELAPSVKAEAIAQVMKSINDRGDLARAKHFHFAFGDALQKAGLWQEAKEQFNYGLALEKNHARAYYHLGEIAQYNEHNFAGAVLNYALALRYTSAENKADQEFRALLQTRVKRLSELLKRDKQDIAERVKQTVLGVVK